MTNGDAPALPGQHAACTNCGKPKHPGVGCSGFAPPEHARWKPGESGNPDGRPKGSPSIRAALRRELAAGHEADPDGIGAKAVSFARAYVAAVEAGNTEQIEAFDALITQVEGKPVEFIQRTDNRIRTVVVKPGEDTPPAMP